MRALVAALLLAFASAAFAQAEEVAHPDARVEARLKELGEELRCLVCQNQTIADSNAELAADLRRQIKEQIAAGKSDKEIVDYMVARYGDFVLYQPPVKSTTLLLWAGPALLVLIGFIALARSVRARRSVSEAPALSAEERERAARLLRGDAAKDAS